MCSKWHHAWSIRIIFVNHTLLPLQAITLFLPIIYINRKSTPVKTSYIEKLMHPPAFPCALIAGCKDGRERLGGVGEGTGGGVTSIRLTNSVLSTLVLIGCGGFSRFIQHPPSSGTMTLPWTKRRLPWRLGTNLDQGSDVCMCEMQVTLFR